MKADYALPEQAPPDKRREGAPRRISRKRLVVLLLACVGLPSLGCRLCCDLEDAAYPAYGGVWERTDRNSGRVGSLLDPGGARIRDLEPRETEKNQSDARNRIAPGLEPRRGGADDQPLPKPDQPGERSEEETEKEFQERYKKFQEERMLNAEIIPGEPMPPSFR